MSRLKKEQKDTLVGEIIKTDFTLQNAMEEAGMEARTYGIWGFFWRLFGKRGAREKRLVKKKTYMLLAVFTGFSSGP